MPNQIVDSVSGSGVFSRVVDNIRGYFNYSLSGTWVGTVTLQRRWGSSGDWLDVDSHTTSTETYGLEVGAGLHYRAGFKAGEYTSGAASIGIECANPGKV